MSAVDPSREVITKHRTAEADLDEGDHDRFAHYVFPKSEVTRAMVTGVSCRALCGKTWVPSRAPESFPVCPTCKQVLAENPGLKA